MGAKEKVVPVIGEKGGTRILELLEITWKQGVRQGLRRGWGCGLRRRELREMLSSHWRGEVGNGESGGQTFGEEVHEGALMYCSQCNLLVGDVGGKITNHQFPQRRGETWGAARSSATSGAMVGRGREQKDLLRHAA